MCEDQQQNILQHHLEHQLAPGMCIHCWLMTFDCRARHENGNQTTMEMVLDFGRAGPTNPSFLYVNRAAVEIIPFFKYLGVHLSYTLTWCTNSAAVFKKAHQHFHLVRNLRRAELNRAFYSCAVEIALMSCFTVVWRLHGGREDGSAAGGKVCSENRRV